MRVATPIGRFVTRRLCGRLEQYLGSSRETTTQNIFVILFNKHISLIPRSRSQNRRREYAFSGQHKPKTAIYLFVRRRAQFALAHLSLSLLRTANMCYLLQGDPECVLSVGHGRLISTAHSYFILSNAHL